ncbi:MAG: outer membrane beta-barrel protein [Bacteroidales bacterium]|nr:outer membrane beta-barrel protein [Bacteroidales bacterium]
MNEKRFEDIIKDKLYSQEYDGEMPSWNEIEKALPKGKRIYFMRFAQIAAAIVASLSLGTWFVLKDNNSQNSNNVDYVAQNATYADSLQSIAQSSDDINIENNNSNSASPDNAIHSKINSESENTSLLFAENLSHTSDKSFSNIKDSESDVENNIIGNKSSNIDLSNNDDLNNQNAVSKEKENLEGLENSAASRQSNNLDEKNESAENSKYEKILNEKENNVNYASLRNNKKKREAKANLNILASNLPISTNNGNSLYAMQAPTTNAIFSYVKNNLFDEKVVEDPMKSSDFKHDIPITLGLSGAYYLNDRLFLETGLFLSYHKSTFENKYYNLLDGKQKAMFLGVPLSIGYDIFKTGNFSWYGGVGGKIDFNIKMEQSYNISNDMFEMKKTIKKPLLSFNVKTGISYNLIEWLSIFAEPSLSHYANTNRYFLSWTKNDLIFDVRFGLRTSF